MSSNSPKLIVFAAPSGAGKTTIVRHLMKMFPQFAFSVSATNRPKRTHEKHGVDYYFLSETSFQQKIQNHEFVEWEEVYPSRFYGTLKSEIDRLMAEGKIVIFDIDVQGALNLKKAYGPNCLTVFVKPKNIEVLVERLTNRQTETEDSLKKRIAKANHELGFEHLFDISILNDSLKKALKIAENVTKIFINVKIPI